MADTTDLERDLIAEMQEDVAAMKSLLDQIEKAAARLVKINHQAGRAVQSGNAMIWQGAVKGLHGDLIAAHGAASIALVQGYDNGGGIVAMGPGR